MITWRGRICANGPNEFGSGPHRLERNERPVATTKKLERRNRVPTSNANKASYGRRLGRTSKTENREATIPVKHSLIKSEQGKAGDSNWTHWSPRLNGAAVQVWRVQLCFLHNVQHPGHLWWNVAGIRNLSSLCAPCYADRGETRRIRGFTNLRHDYSVSAPHFSAMKRVKATCACVSLTFRNRQRYSNWLYWRQYVWRMLGNLLLLVLMQMYS